MNESWDDKYPGGFEAIANRLFVIWHKRGGLAMERNQQVLKGFIRIVGQNDINNDAVQQHDKRKVSEAHWPVH